MGDVVANLRVDQAWGEALARDPWALSHEVNASYYSAANALPVGSDTTGGGSVNRLATSGAGLPASA